MRDDGLEVPDCRILDIDDYLDCLCIGEGDGHFLFGFVGVLLGDEVEGAEDLGYLVAVFTVEQFFEKLLDEEFTAFNGFGFGTFK